MSPALSCPAATTVPSDLRPTFWPEPPDSDSILVETLEVVGVLEDVPTVKATSLINFDGNRYSIPVEYGISRLMVHAYVWRVEIACGDRVIATHQRCY